MTLLWWLVHAGPFLEHALFSNRANDLHRSRTVFLLHFSTAIFLEFVQFALKAIPVKRLFWGWVVIIGAVSSVRIVALGGWGWS